jgi:adenylate cyclase
MSFFSELKRRNVFRVALLYMVASWLIMQVTDVGVSLLGLPDWTGRFVFLMLLIGFPLVMVFSWAYEITPEGLKKERDVPRDQSITDETARKLNTAVIVLLLVSLGTLGLDRLIPEQAVQPEAAAEAEPQQSGPPEQSIAVLPFTNMSADADNEYFSDGLSEELLNLLAKIPELQVAARTSAFSFKGTGTGIPEIARKLNVAHVLEGSVRKSGDEIRITAQLINAADGYHVWSETWDRRLVDVFAIQDEISALVVDALKVSLLGELPHARVTDPEAYELYLQGKAEAQLFSEEGFQRATQLLTEALAIDPEYAEAWVALGTTITNQTGWGLLPQADGYERAKRATERALAIEPDNARALASLGWKTMYNERDFEEAARLIRRAYELEPGNAGVLNAYAVLNGIFGKLDRMTSLYEDALERDPFAMSVLGNLSGAYNTVGRYEESQALIDRMREISPDSNTLLSSESFLHWFRGDAEAALDGFSRLGGSLGNLGRALSLYDLGRDDEAAAIVETMSENDESLALLAVWFAYAGDTDGAFEHLERALAINDDEIAEIRMYAVLDRLYDDPRWEDLLARIGNSDADAEQIGL